MDNVSDPVFNGQLPTPFHNRKQYLPEQSIHSRIELNDIHALLGNNTFEPCNYPNIIIAQSGVPYFRKLDVKDGVNNSMLKVFMIDCTDCPNDIQIRIQQLKSHVQGVFGYGKAESGFMHIKDLMKGNRDGPTTAFTTGLNLFNSWCVSPVAHSVEKDDGDNRVATWIQQFHILLGDLAQEVMPTFMSAEYIDFCKTRKIMFNSPCFGLTYDTQSYFTSAQINCSDGKTHVCGKAGDIHTDAQDCNASYSMSLNLSVVKPSSNLGYFWFPNLDLMVPIRPSQLIIFQGIEEHTGTPLYVDENDTSPLPLGYANDVRFNVIAYPKSGIINGTSPRNLNGTLAAAPKINLYQHALPHFGGELNYQKWIKIEMSKSIVKRAKEESLIEGIEFDIEAIFKAITLPSQGGDTEAQASTSTVEIFDVIEVETFQIRLKFIQAMVAKYLRKTFTDKEAIAINNISNSLEVAGHQEEPITYDKLARGLMASSNSGIFDENNESCVIDPRLLQHDAELAAFTNEVFDPLPSGFVNAFKEQFAIDKLDNEIDILSCHTRAHTVLGKGIERVISMLPSLADLDSINPVTTTDICFIYGNAMSVFFDKINEAQFVAKGFRASFMKLFLEVFSMFDVNRFNVWEIQDMSFTENSLGLKLRNMIDSAFTDWSSKPQSARVFEVSASELLGSQYNPKVHLDIKLSEVLNRNFDLETNPNQTKAYILLQTIWGLCIHQPISNFYSMFLQRGVYNIRVYKDRLASSKNIQRSRIINRFQNFWIMLDHFNLDKSEATHNGLLMLDGFYNLAFGFNSRDFIDLQQLPDFTVFLDPTEEEERRGKILHLASIYIKLFDSSSLLEHRGSRKLRVFSQTHIDRNAVQQRSIGQKRKAQIEPASNACGSVSKQRLDHQLTFLPNIESNSPAQQLDGFLLRLFQYLYQVSQVGKQIISMRHQMKTQHKSKTDINNPLVKDISDIGLRKFMVLACNTVTNGDRLISYRLKGPSFELIQSYYPTPASCQANLQRFLWHLFLWRVFGFGRLEVIRKLHSASTVEEGLSILCSVDKSLRKPLSNINAYGSLYIPLQSRPAILNGMYNLSKILSQRLLQTTMTFASVQEIIESHSVPYMPSTGLVSWLIICDLAEYDLCASPTVKDLVNRIGEPPLQKNRGPGGSGPREALFVVEEECKMLIPFSTKAQLQNGLTQVFDALQHSIGEECRTIQGRNLSMADIEHMLCKISREAKL